MLKYHNFWEGRPPPIFPLRGTRPPVPPPAFDAHESETRFEREWCYVSTLSEIPVPFDFSVLVSHQIAFIYHLFKGNNPPLTWVFKLR